MTEIPPAPPDPPVRSAGLSRAEERAGSRAALLEAVLGCIADGVVVYDEDGRTVLSSPAADVILGVPPGEREGPVGERAARQYEIYSESGARLDREDMVAVRAALHGETIRGVVQRVGVAGRPPRWLMMNAVPLVLGGRPAGAVLSLTDITDRKHAEAELAVMTRLYAVRSRVNEAIVRMRDERALFAEVCQIVAEEGRFPLVWVGLVEGRAVVPAAAAGDAASYVHEIRVEVDGPLGEGPTGACIREGRPVRNDDFETNAAAEPWRAATARHGLRASASFPLRCGGPTVGALVLYAPEPAAFSRAQLRLLNALAADLSYALEVLGGERRRAEAEEALRRSEAALRESDRRKDEFLGMLSHELRNPLAPIRSAVEVLRRAEGTSAVAERARDVIHRQVAHLTRLVDDLLDVTRIARGKIEVRRERLDLCELTRRAAEDFREAMRERGLGFDVALPPAAVWVEADATRLAQVLGNLLHNAAKFSRAGDSVALELAMLDGACEVRVRDTGVGIEPTLLPDLFEPFVQGTRTLARSEGGLGLGLALVKGIVALHGGEVRAASAGPGQGAEFTLRLPLAAQAEPPIRRGAAVPARRRRVLVVDDNVDAAESLADLLRLAGHEPAVAYDGPAAIAAARAGAPEVVLCDIGLPGLSGYEVARALRAEARVAGAFLIALTGYAQQDYRTRAREAGFDAHLAKPPDVDALLALVAEGRDRSR